MARRKQSSPTPLDSALIERASCLGQEAAQAYGDGDDERLVRRREEFRGWLSTLSKKLSADDLDLLNSTFSRSYQRGVGHLPWGGRRPGAA
jgi:hypothetical protein